MQPSKSFFTNKSTDEDLETIQRALVIAHQYYASNNDYEGANNITRLLSENLDKDGALKITCRDTDSCPYFQKFKIKTEAIYENQNPWQSKPRSFHCIRNVAHGRRTSEL